MKRSKLETYIDILDVLRQNGTLKVTHIMYKSNVNCTVLKQYLTFLLKQGLIQEKIVAKNNVVYANTAYGTIVLKSFRELAKALPMQEEKNKIGQALY